MSETDWLAMPHECPKEMEPYLTLLCEACGADSELKLLTRFQKVLRKIHDDLVVRRTNGEI